MAHTGNNARRSPTCDPLKVLKDDQRIREALILARNDAEALRRALLAEPDSRDEHGVRGMHADK